MKFVVGILRAFPFCLRNGSIVKANLFYFDRADRIFLPQFYISPFALPS